MYDLKYSYMISSETFISFLTHSNFTNPKHLKIYQPFLNYIKTCNHSLCTQIVIIFFPLFFLLSTKERKAKFNTDHLIFRKKSSLPFGTPLSVSSYVDIERSSAEYNSAESLRNKYKLFGTKSKQTVNFSNIRIIPFSLSPSKKYKMIEKFDNRLKSLKNILNEIKKT